MSRKTLCAAAIVLSLAGAAVAAPGDPPNMEELVGLGACAAATGLYEYAIEEGKGTAADRDLLDRTHALQPRLEAYFDPKVDALSDDQREELKRRVKAATTARLDRYKDSPDLATEVLADFRPDLEACIKQAQTLPQPPASGS
jgi:hypothetical protein